MVILNSQLTIRINGIDIDVNTFAENIINEVDNTSEVYIRTNAMTPEKVDAITAMRDLHEFELELLRGDEMIWSSSKYNSLKRFSFDANADSHEYGITFVLN